MAETDTSDAGQTDTTDTTSADDGTTDLGDAGKRALDAERAARKKAERAAKSHEAELAKLREAAMSEQEKAIAAARAETEQSVRDEMGKQILGARLTAAAGGRLVDPDDAIRYIDMSDLEDSPEALSGAIDALIESKPYLAVTATGPSGFDAGSRGSGNPTDMNDFMRRAISGRR